MKDEFISRGSSLTSRSKLKLVLLHKFIYLFFFFSHVIGDKSMNFLFGWGIRHFILVVRLLNRVKSSFISSFDRPILLTLLISFGFSSTEEVLLLLKILSWIFLNKGILFEIIYRSAFMENLGSYLFSYYKEAGK